MCPPLSCCHRRCSSALSTHIYHLVRLLLASGTDELLPGHRLTLQARMDALWDRIEAALQRHGEYTAQARDLTERLLATLLREGCCRRALRRAVSLPEALGLAVLLDWEAEALSTRSSWGSSN